jgi:predicted aconitase
VRLDATDKALLAGEFGGAAQRAMNLLLRYGEVLGAGSFVDIASAHIDSCLYHGRSGLDFVQALLDDHRQVRVPTTLNVTAFDLDNPGLSDVSAETIEIQQEMVRSYLELGCLPTMTCAPYQARRRPAFGQHIAWAESNAIVFANSVLGARTDRYGDFTDICAALTGRVPLAGLHLGENRLATMVLDVPGPERCRMERDLYFSALGYVLGERAGNRVAAIVGAPPDSSEDDLKAVGAAAASSGAVALFHVVGVTPEAANLEQATGRDGPVEHSKVSVAELNAVPDRLCTVQPGEPVSALCVGTPHFSEREFRRMADRVAGRHAAPGVRVLVSTSRAVRKEVETTDWFGTLEAFGVELLTDTCTYLHPAKIPGVGVVVTNSAKWAHYAPGTIARRAALMSLERCLRCAEEGKIVA